MKGVLRSALLFCLAWKLQRLFVGAGLVLTVAVFLFFRMVQPSRAVVTTWSALLDVMLIACIWGTLCLGSVTFRGASAPRTLRFVPYARLQLLLGVLLAQVLLAALVTLKVAVLYRASTPPWVDGVSLTSTFVVTLAMMSLGVLWAFFLFSDSPRSRWLAVLVMCIGAAMLFWQLAFGIAPSQVGNASIASATIAAWTLFAVWYLRARRISPPPALTDGWGTGRMPRTKDIGTRRAALNMYLLGRDSVLHACWSEVALILVFNAVFVGSMLALIHRGGPSPLDLSYVLTMTFLIAGSVGLQLASPIAQRARALWIRSGCSRQELFETAERLSLRCLACVGIPTLALSVVEWRVLPHGSADWRYLLFIGLATLLCNVYFGLAGAGRRSPGIFAVIASGAVDILILLPNSLWLSWGVNYSHALILTVELLLALALRPFAQWRWQRIDWLICKPASLSAQAMRPVT